MLLGALILPLQGHLQLHIGALVLFVVLRVDLIVRLATWPLSAAGDAVLGSGSRSPAGPRRRQGPPRGSHPRSLLLLLPRPQGLCVRPRRLQRPLETSVLHLRQRPAAALLRSCAVIAVTTVPARPFGSRPLHLFLIPCTALLGLSFLAPCLPGRSGHPVDRQHPAHGALGAPHAAALQQPAPFGLATVAVMQVPAGLGALGVVLRNGAEA